MSNRKKISGAIVKKDEKASNIIVMLGDDNSEPNFISKFIEVYPDECRKYRNAYQEQEKLSGYAKRNVIQQNYSRTQ